MDYTAEDFEGGVPQYPARLEPAHWRCPECGEIEYEDDEDNY